MKKIASKTVLLTGLFCGSLLISCQETLQEEVFSFVSTDNFYKTPADAEAAVYAAYEPFLANAYFGYEYYNLCLLADDQVTIGRNPVFQAVDNFNLNADHAFVNNSWRQMYLCINRANTAIQRIPAIDMDASRRAALIGECYFIRAYNYFNLVRLFGGVPLTVGEIGTPGQTNTPKATKEQVYQQIINDLTEAEKSLPLSRTGAQVGRITKGAAQTLLAEVYLTLERWPEAASKAKEVIDSGQYALLPDFKRIFAADNERNQEIIFSIQFDGPIIGTSYAAYAHGGGADNPNTALGAQVWSVEEQSDMWKNWNAEDSRKAFTVYTEFVSRAGRLINLRNTARPFPAFGKYNSPNESAQNKCPINPIAHRYADVLLIYAEAASQAGGGPDQMAYQAVNQIRRRAYQLPINTVSRVDLLAGLSPAQFREAVIRERSLEFVIENKRLFDLMRTGQFPAILKTQGKTINERAKLFPIPQAEINANSALTAADQNEGY
ncbi:RagB/SusD family nutrient uptake outer membrane protein [Larkinella harenae]